MEIKRTTEIFVKTNRRFVVHQPPSSESLFCPHCAEPMLAAEQIAVVFGVSRRTVYKHVETGAAHFAETETGAVMICPASLQEILEAGAKHLPGETTEDS